MFATHDRTTGTESPDISTIPEAVVAPWMHEIWGFSGKTSPPVCLFHETRPIPDDVERAVCIIVDLSGSMDRHRREVKTALASMIRGSNAEGKVHIPMPNGPTALVLAVSTLACRLVECDVIVVTDGQENQQEDPITILHPDGAEVCYPFAGDKSSGEYLECVANFVTAACKHQLYLVGIGADSERAAGAFLRRRNCHVALVMRGATNENIIGTIGALRARGRAQARLSIADCTPQDAVSFELTAEAAAYVARMDTAELQAVVASGTAITIATTPASPELSPADIESMLQAGEEAIEHNWVHAYDKPTTRAYALLALLSMVDHGVPLVIFTAKRWGIFTSNPDIGKRLNQLFSALVRVGLVKRINETPKEGVLYDGYKVPGQSAVYRCLAPAHALQTVMTNAAFASDQTTLVKRPPRNSVPSETGGKRKRDGQ